MSQVLFEIRLVGMSTVYTCPFGITVFGTGRSNNCRFLRISVAACIVVGNGNKQRITLIGSAADLQKICLTCFEVRFNQEVVIVAAIIISSQRVERLTI